MMAAMNLRPTLLTLAAGWILLPGCTQIESGPPPAPVAAEKPVAKKIERKPKKVGVSFTKSIKPILANQCTICHNAEVLSQRPYFETRDSAMRSGMIIPGKPELSRLLAVVEEEAGADKAMPPVSHQLTKKQISLLRRWISEGADWPAGEAGRVQPAFIPRE